MENYKFSVAMSVYKNDNPEQLKIALNSVCFQSCTPDEVFLVIDGHIPDSLEKVIESFTKNFPYFTIERLEKNGGLGNALRIAMKKCRNDLVFRMDSDDISAPDRFKKQLDYYSKNPVDVLGTWTLGFFGDLHTGSVSEFRPPIDDEKIKTAMKHTTAVSHVSVLLNRNSVISSGNYLDLFYHEDYYLWVRMIKNGCTFANVPEHLVYVRCGDSQAKRHGGKKYYLAERELRRYMLECKLISKREYKKEMFLRFVYQRIMLPSLRCFIDKRVKRKYLSRAEANRIIGKSVTYEKLH